MRRAKWSGYRQRTHSHWVNSISVWRTKWEWTSSRVSAKNQVAGTAGGAVLPLSAAQINAPSAVYTFRSTAFRSRRLVFFFTSSLIFSSQHAPIRFSTRFSRFPIGHRAEIAITKYNNTCYLIDFPDDVWAEREVSSNNYALIDTNWYSFCPRQSRSQWITPITDFLSVTKISRVYTRKHMKACLLHWLYIYRFCAVRGSC